MYLALTLLSMLAFLALCLVGLFTLIKQAIADPRFSPPHVFIEDDPVPAAAAPFSAARSSVTPTSAAPTFAARTYAARSEDAEGNACGQGCA
jgi:hypothetical protein